MDIFDWYRLELDFSGGAKYAEVYRQRCQKE